jgi:hypothetical protein
MGNATGLNQPTCVGEIQVPPVQAFLQWQNRTQIQQSRRSANLI